VWDSAPYGLQRRLESGAVWDCARFCRRRSGFRAGSVLRRSNAACVGTMKMDSDPN
jgi:hypothetical protein